MAGLSFGQSTTSYLDGSISPSASEKISSSPIADYLNADLNFGTDVTGADIIDNLSGQGALNATNALTKGGWKFITAPEDVSWSTANSANRVDIFGTNNPPVVAGSRGMRDLTLGNALVEGFVRGKKVEQKIAALENLLNYNLNTSDGFVSVPVYRVFANWKTYGGPSGYFIIKDVRVKEVMRDLRGDATRAFVDISMMQVPAYQVNSGRDQASEAVSGATSSILPNQPAGTTPTQVAANQANQGLSPTSGGADTKSTAGPNSATPAPAPANTPAPLNPNQRAPINAPPPR
jgi:hypothetical protein